MVYPPPISFHFRLSNGPWVPRVESGVGPSFRATRCEACGSDDGGASRDPPELLTKTRVGLRDIPRLGMCHRNRAISRVPLHTRPGFELTCSPNLILAEARKSCTPINQIMRLLICEQNAAFLHIEFHRSGIKKSLRLKTLNL